MEERTIKLWKRYRHYKGKEYMVINIATHSETDEKLVIYKPLFVDDGLWIRPLESFLGKVEVDGKMVDRFVEIE